MAKKKVEPGSEDLVVDLYEDDELKNIRYGSWVQKKDGRYLVPALLSGSDYSGTLVQRSNHDAFARDFADGQDEWWTSVSGGHGTYAIVIDMENAPDEVAEFLNALADYPLADEQLHSEMEMNAQNEAWEDWGRKDFIREIEKQHEVELDDVDEKKVDEIFYEAAEHANEYWINEEGDTAWINLKRVVDKGISKEDVKQLLESKAG